MSHDQLSSEDALHRRYANALREIEATLADGWSVVDRPTRGISWRLYGPSSQRLPRQGWKLHVSADASEAVDLCKRVLPLLVRHLATFKLPTSVSAIARLNSGALGRSQTGKVITIYPSSDEHAATLIPAIHRVWPTTRGPLIPSDLRYRSDSPVYFRFGAFFNPRPVVDMCGRRTGALSRPDGIIEADHLGQIPVIPDWAPPPPTSFVPCEIPEIDGRISVNDVTYLKLVMIQESYRSAVMLCVDTRDCNSVIIKTSRADLGGDIRGHTAKDRFLNEFEVLSALAGTGNVAPKPIALSTNGPLILVLEDLGGRSLASLTQSEQIRSLPLLASTLARLHDAGFAHRDVKLCNALLVGDHVQFVDYELAAPISEGDVILGGTAGYTPPEGLSLPANSEADIFALGICLAHVLLRRDPAALPAGTGRLIGLMHLAGAHQPTEAFRALTHHSLQMRPSAREARLILQEIALSTESPSKGANRLATKLATRNWAYRAALEAALSTRRYRVASAVGSCWSNFHYQADFLCEGVNLGASGIILGLISVDQALGRNDFRGDVESGADWLLDVQPSPDSCGLFTGTAGVAVALAVAGRTLESTRHLKGARLRLEQAAAAVQPVDLFSGAAGVVWAACLIAEILREGWPLQVVEARALDLLKSLRATPDGVPVWVPHQEADEPAGHYIGVAHGSAGVAMALAGWGQRVGSNHACEVSKGVFHALFEKGRTEDGTGLRIRSKPVRTPSPSGNWCHGAAGYLWALLQAFGDSTEFEAEIDWATTAFAASSPLGNPTYCHGLAGRLELWRMIGGIPRYRILAQRGAAGVAATLRLLQQRVDGKIVWCSDDPATITPDLWLGFIGAASALGLYAAGRTDALLSAQWLSACATGRPR